MAILKRSIVTNVEGIDVPNVSLENNQFVYKLMGVKIASMFVDRNLDNLRDINVHYSTFSY